jgi:biopolymer transport protein ExbD
MKREPYPTDLSDEQGKLPELILLPTARSFGRKRKRSKSYPQTIKIAARILFSDKYDSSNIVNDFQARKMRKIRLVTILMIYFALSGCVNSPKIIRVDLIDRNTFAALYEKPNQNLLVRIDENGRLSLNKIETGTISDLSDLSEKIEVLFDDREKAGISDREVVIDPQGKVKNEDLEKLIESLASVKAAPIRVIKNNL